MNTQDEYHSLEVPHLAASKEYPLFTFLWRNKKKDQQFLVEKMLT